MSTTCYQFSIEFLMFSTVIVHFPLSEKVAVSTFQFSHSTATVKCFILNQIKVQGLLSNHVTSDDVLIRTAK